VYKRIPRKNIISLRLLSARCEINKSLKLFTSAWWDTKRMSALVPLSEFLQRHIDTSLELSNWSEVEKTATKLLAIRPSPETNKLISLAKIAKEHNIKMHPEFENGWIKQFYPNRSVTEHPKWFEALNSYLRERNFPIAISDIPGRGRGVRATKNIQKGQIVFVEAPIAAGTLREDVCYHCMRPLSVGKEPRVFPCPESSHNSCTAVYCSTECRDLSLSLYHQPLCGNPLREVKKYVTQSGNMQLLPIARLAAMSIQQGFDVTKSPHIELLHSRMAYQTLLPVFQQQEAFVKDLPKEWGDEFDFEWFLELDLRFSANCFSTNHYSMNFLSFSRDVSLSFDSHVCVFRGPKMAPQNLRKFIIGLYHVASFINHDCLNRNVTIDWPVEMGNNIVISALRDISRGEEITQWYFEPENSQAYRYGIECNCKYCEATTKEFEEYCKRLALYGNETTNALLQKVHEESRS
jgi:hypothetical protein